MSPTLEVLNQASAGALASILNSLWQAVALALCAWLVMRFAPRRLASTRHRLWWAVLAVILLMPWIPGPPLPEPARPEPAATAAAAVESLPAEPVEAIAVDEAPAPPAPEVSTPVAMRPGSWPLFVLVIWAVAMLLQFFRLAWSYAYLRGVKQRSEDASPELRLIFEQWLRACGIRRRVRLVVSNEIASPLAVGFRKPAVILPRQLLAELQQPELDHVLLHELAHIARRDDWSNLIARLAGGALVFHPVANWVLRRIEREREMACDEWVVAVTGAARPYAASLARLFELCFVRRRMLLASGMAERPSHLGERIERLLHRKPDSPRRYSILWITLSTLVMLSLVIAGAVTPRWVTFADQPPARAVRVATQPPPPSSPGPQPVAAPNGSFLAALVAAGYGETSVDDIINLRASGVSADFLTALSKSGWEKLAPSEIIDLCHSGVNPEYLRNAKDAGFAKIAIADVIELHNAGARPELFQQIHAMGFGPFSIAEAVDFTHRGASLELFTALKDYGLTNAVAEEIMEAHSIGLNTHDINSAKQFGTTLTLKQIIKLKKAGVL